MPSRVGGAVAEEDQVRAAQHRDRRVVGGDVAPAASRRPARGAAGEHGVDHVERRQIDEPGVRAGVRAERSRTPRSTSRRASDDDEFLAVGGRAARHVADLRVFDRERRRLAHLPAHQLIEILRRAPAPARSAPATPWRPGRARPGRRAADGPMRSSTRATARRRPPRDRGRWRRSATARARRPAAARSRAPRPPAGRRAHSSAGRRHAVGRDLDGDAGGGARRAERGQDAHSTNVTLLISRSVVDAVHARARPPTRAGSACPSSRAAFLISEVGRFSRIISRM